MPDSSQLSGIDTAPEPSTDSVSIEDLAQSLKMKAGSCSELNPQGQSRVEFDWLLHLMRPAPLGRLVLADILFDGERVDHWVG